MTVVLLLSACANIAIPVVIMCFILLMKLIAASI